MNYKVSTTLKKADTEGRIPAYTLDQYVRNELSLQLVDALKPNLTINRCDVSPNRTPALYQATVDFTAEVVLLQPQQWQTLRTLLAETRNALSPEQQHVLKQLINMVENR